jgi:hypothetical protein
MAGPNELRTFAPLVAAGSGFVALTIGQRFGLLSRPQDKERAADRFGLFHGILGAGLTAITVALVVYLLLGRLFPLPLRLRVGAAWALGVAFAGSTRILIDWARERLGAKGVLTDFLEARVSGTELVALLGVAPISALFFSPEVSVPSLLYRSAFPIALGLLLGHVALALLRRESALGETWGILLGALFLATGLSLRFGSSVMTAGYVLGWVLGRDRNSGHALRLLTHPTEGAVILPLLVIAGASVDWVRLGELGIVVVISVVTGVLIKLVVAWWLRSRLPVPEGSTLALGLTFNASGEVTCLLGLEIWLVGPAGVGQLALASVVLVSLVGEFVSARSIRSLLTIAGEVEKLDAGGVCTGPSVTSTNEGAP